MFTQSSILKKIWNQSINTALGVIAPESCFVCGAALCPNNEKKFLCNKCLDNLPYAPQPHEIINKLITNYKRDELAISAVYSLMGISPDDEYMELIYSLKYKNYYDIGYELGAMLGLIMKKYSPDYDYIVPVPIHHARKRERGYNQSLFIAKGIASALRIPVNEKIIKRHKYTRTQTALSKDERRNNLLNVIRPHGDIDISGKRILITDDVLTTGSTLNSCADILLNIGAERVDAATLVFAQKS